MMKTSSEISTSLAANESFETKNPLFLQGVKGSHPSDLNRRPTDYESGQEMRKVNNLADLRCAQSCKVAQNSP